MTKTTDKTALQNINESLKALEDILKSKNKIKSEYVNHVQNVIINFVQGYNNTLNYNSDILKRLVYIVQNFDKSDLRKLGYFFTKFTTIKSVSIKDASKFTTLETIVKTTKTGIVKEKIVKFLDNVDIDNLPLWYDLKIETAKKDTPLAKKLLSNVKTLVNTIDSIEDDTKLLTLVTGIYKQLDTLQKQLEQINN